MNRIKQTLKVNGSTGVVFVLALFMAAHFLLPTGAAGGQAPQKVLEIGSIYDLHGPVGHLGVNVIKAVQLAVDEINEAGGIKIGPDAYLVKNIIRSDGYDPKISLAKGVELILGRNIKFIMSFGCGPALKICEVSEPEKVIHLGICSGDSLLKGKKYTFRLYAIDLQKAIPQFHYLKAKHPDFKTIFVTNENDASGWHHAAAAKAAAEYYGYKCLGMEYFEHKAGEAEVAPLAEKIISLNPDVLHINTLGGGITLAKILWKKGYRGQLITNTGGDISAMKKMAPLSEGLLTPAVNWNSELLPPKIKAFASNYKKRFGSEALQWGPAAYADIYLIAEACKKAGTITDTERIRKVLETETFDSPYGKVKMGGKAVWGVGHHCFMPELAGQYRKGEVSVVHSVDAKTVLKDFTAIAAKIKVIPGHKK